jgi:signal transduction histidine kinase/ActR/RegA family two-component response regulator
MIIETGTGNEKGSAENISDEKRRLKLTLDRISRRAYFFLALLTIFSLVALLVNTFAGFRITKAFSPSKNEAGNAVIELMAAGRDLESAIINGEQTVDLAQLHLSSARLHTLEVLDLGFQTSGLFSAALPADVADELQRLLRELDPALARIEQVNESGGLPRIPSSEQASLRSSIGSLIMRSKNIEAMLGSRIDFENTLFRNSGVLAALGILLLATFAGVWFRRFDRLRSAQFDASVLAEADLRQRESALEDRIKELNCLYRFSQIVESNKKTLDGLLQEVVQVIPLGWKYSDVAAARLVVGERSYSSPKFRETPWMQIEPIRLNGQEVGTLQVAYLVLKPELDEGPFSIEERALLKALAEQMDSLLHKFQLRDQVRATRKYEGIGALISGIAHDFNNILFAIMGNAEMSLSRLNAADRSYSNIKNIVQATNRARDLTKQLISCTKPAKDQPDSIPVNRVVDEVVKLIRASLPSTIKLDLKFYKPQTYVFAQFTEIHQIILNLSSNAGYAMRDSGGILRISVDEIEMRRSSFRPGGVVNTDKILAAHPHLRQGSYVRIAIRDTGCGIPEKLRERIFEPFFSTKPAEEGTGMGLFNVRDIVSRLNGVVHCESWPGEGSRFEVYLPSAPPSATTEELRDVIPRGSERVLLVDDEQDIVSMLDAMLTELGYAVTTFTDSRKALQDFAANPDAYDLLLTDLTMPDMTGAKLIDHICNIKPGLPAIMMSGNDAPPEGENGTTASYTYLKKPVTKMDLAKIIRRSLVEHGPSAAEQLEEQHLLGQSGVEVA